MLNASAANARNTGRRVRLGEVVENINDFFDPNSNDVVRYVAGEHIDEGDLLVKRYGQTSDELVPPTFNRLFKAGDVLFHSRNIEKLAQPHFDGLTGEKIFVLRTKDQARLLQDFLPYLLQSRQFKSYVEERWAGSTNKFLNKSPLMAYEFDLPEIDEQRRLCRVLAEMEQVSDAQLKLAVAAAEATLSAAVTWLHIKGLDPFRGYTQGIPQGCTLGRGETLFTPQSGNGEPNAFERDGDVLFLKVSDFNLNDELEIDKSESRFFAKKNPSLKIFDPGTVVFPKRGASIFLNRVGVLRARAALDPNLMALTSSDPHSIRPEFLYWLIKAIGLYRIADVTSVPQLNHKHLLPLRFALPDAASREKVVDALGLLRGAWKAAEARRSSTLMLKEQFVKAEIG